MEGELMNRTLDLLHLRSIAGSLQDELLPADGDELLLLWLSVVLILQNVLLLLAARVLNNDSLLARLLKLLLLWRSHY